MSESAPPTVSASSPPPMGASSVPIACPFCGSKTVEMVSPWAGQLITSQLRCRECNTYFEAIRGPSGDDQLPRGSDADG